VVQTLFNLKVSEMIDIEQGYCAFLIAGANIVEKSGNWWKRSEKNDATSV